MEHVTDNRTGLNHAGPPCKRRDADAALPVIALPSAEHGLSHSEPGRRIVNHWAVVTMRDDHRVLGDAESLERIHQLTKEGIDRGETVAKKGPCDGRFLRIRDECRHGWPVGNVEGVLLCRVLLDECKRALLALGVDVVVIRERARLPLEHLSILGALHRRDPIGRTKILVYGIGVVGKHVLHHTLHCVRTFTNLVPEAEHLVIGHEERFVEALVRRVALFDITEMPLAIEGRCVARIREHVGNCHLFACKAGRFYRERNVVHPGAHGISAGHARCPAGGASSLGVVAGIQRTLGRHTIAIWRVETAHLVQSGNAGIAERHIVPHDVHDIRLRAELLLEFGELRVEFFVLDLPCITVLVKQDVVLSVVDDRAGCGIGHRRSPHERREVVRGPP